MTTFTLDVIRTAVKSELQDDGQFLTPDEIDTHITNAINQVSHDRAFRKVADITGDGTRDYSLPTDFEKGFSSILRVEAPADENPPVYPREDDDWILYENPTKSPTQRLLFLTVQPTSTEVIRVTYSAPWAVTESASDLDRTAFLAVMYKVLELALAALANRFTQSTDPTIVADAVDYGARGQNFLFASNEWKTKYKQIIGLAEGVVAPAAAFKEKDINFSSGEQLVWRANRDR